jgi:hypothetical protein
MEGGNYTVYVREGSCCAMPSNVRFIDNLFGRTYRYGLLSTDGPITWENNRWADNNEIIPQ